MYSWLIDWLIRPARQVLKCLFCLLWIASWLFYCGCAGFVWWIAVLRWCCCRQSRKFEFLAPTDHWRRWQERTSRLNYEPTTSTHSISTTLHLPLLGCFLSSGLGDAVGTTLTLFSVPTICASRICGLKYCSAAAGQSWVFALHAKVIVSKAQSRSTSICHSSPLEGALLQLCQCPMRLEPTWDTYAVLPLPMPHSCMAWTSNLDSCFTRSSKYACFELPLMACEWYSTATAVLKVSITWRDHLRFKSPPLIGSFTSPVCLELTLLR